MKHTMKLRPNPFRMILCGEKTYELRLYDEKRQCMELYFETEDFDAFMQLLNSYPQVERLHEPKTFSWLQRGIHIFDPDGHLIEVSESMYSVACKQFKEGKTIEETAQLVQHPIEVVRGWYEQYKKELISVCGTECRACYCFGKMCNGCNSCEGKVFHAPEGKACPIYDCVRNNKCMQNCGECGEVPCKIWFDTRDPKFSDEEFNENIAMREYQVRNHTLFDYRNQLDIPIAYEKLSMLADELIEIQTEEYEFFNFSEFHPDKMLFQEAEKVSKIKERVVDALTKEYYLDCSVKGVKVRDLLVAYNYLDTLSEVLYFASLKYIDDKKQDTYTKEISLINVKYLIEELARIHREVAGS